jgi:hypothetical protein
MGNILDLSGMELKKENFKLLLQLADTAPQLSSIMIKYRIVKIPIGDAKVTAIQPVDTDIIILNEKIKEFLAGQIPNITVKESKKIRGFLPFQLKQEVRNLSKKVMQDITDNAENISDQSQLKRHLKNLADEIEPIVYALKEIARIDELNENNTYAMPFELIKEYPFYQDKDLTKEEKQTIRLFTKLLIADNSFFYRVFRDVKHHIDHIRHDEGFIDLDKQYVENNKQVKQNEPIKTLEDAVINNNALHKIYSLLIEAKLIDKDTKILMDEGKGKKGILYSTLILFYVKGYFEREPEKFEYLNICKNSFNVTIGESTARNHKTRKQSVLNIPHFTEID